MAVGEYARLSDQICRLNSTDLTGKRSSQAVKKYDHMSRWNPHNIVDEIASTTSCTRLPCYTQYVLGCPAALDTLGRTLQTAY
eukprot:2218981-Pleurochrysis_carterae.AAC.1